MRVAVLTSGGDAPGMNAAIRSIVKASIARGHEAIGIRNGYEGLLDAQTVPLSLQDVDGISRRGGTLLGSARSARFPTEAGQELARQRIGELGIDGLVVIGGNGSLTGAHVLAASEPCRIVGLPASIDNDIGFTRLSIGVDTAVNTIVEACDRISDTAAAHRRAFVVEVMGRHCGYLAMRAGVAADADAILFAEAGHDRTETMRRLEDLLRRSFAPERNKLRVLIIKAEGVEIPTAQLVAELGAWLDNHVPGVSIRETILGHVVRGGSPSALDRMIAQRLAVGAVLGLELGAHDEMLAWDAPPVGIATWDASVRRIGLGEVLAETSEMLDATSASTRARVAMLTQAERLLAL